MSLPVMVRFRIKPGNQSNISQYVRLLDEPGYKYRFRFLAFDHIPECEFLTLISYSQRHIDAVQQCLNRLKLFVLKPKNH